MNQLALQNYVKKYGSLITFLAIEILLFISINLANYGMLFRYLAIILAIAALPFPLLINRKHQWRDFLYLAVPLVLFALFMMIAFAIHYPNFLSLINNIATALGIIAFMFMGYALRRSPNFNIENGLMVIFIGIGLLLSISLVYTLWRYTFFYVLRYEGQALYFEGERYLISSEAKWLFGFTFKEVNLRYFGMFSAVLASLLPALLFVNFKQLKRTDFIWMIAGFVGLLSIVLLPNLRTLVFLIPSTIIALTIRFYPRNETSKKVLIGVGAFAGLIVVLAGVMFLLNTYQVTAISNLIASNSILNYLFNNRLVAGFSVAILDMGNRPFGGTSIINIGGTLYSGTNSFLFDTLHQGGIIPFLSIIAFLVIAIIGFVHYFVRSKDKPHLKILIMSFIMTYFVYTLVFFEFSPMIRENDQAYKFPFYYDLLLLPVLFLIGYSFTSFNKTSINKQKTLLNNGNLDEKTIS
jgi:hypothetical protein